MANILYFSFPKNINFLLKPFPKNVNLFNNFGYIQYKGICFKRINLDSNNGLTLEGLIYSPIEGINLNKNNNNFTISDNFCIEINKSENENMIIDSEDNKQKNYNNYFYKNNSIKSKDDKYNNENSNILLNKQIDMQPFPPEKFIKIIYNIDIQNKNKNNLNLNLNIMNKTNIKIINNIILNNIQLITNDTFQINYNNNFIDNKEIQNFKTKDTKLLSKRRKKQESIKRVHSAGDDDNILRKIQVHFLSFIINFTNDVINTLINDKTLPKFKNLDYNIKKTVNHKFVEHLKSKKIGEILQLKVSPKMKINDESVNRNIYNTIWEKCPCIHEYFTQSYLTLFKEYYNNNNKIFIVNGKIIKLSSKTKTFNDLIRKNFQYKEKMKYVSINYFLNCYKRLKKPNFKTHILKK